MFPTYDLAGYTLDELHNAIADESEQHAGFIGSLQWLKGRALRDLKSDIAKSADLIAQYQAEIDRREADHARRVCRVAAALSRK